MYIEFILTNIYADIIASSIHDADRDMAHTSPLVTKGKGC